MNRRAVRQDRCLPVLFTPLAPASAQDLAALLEKAENLLEESKTADEVPQIQLGPVSGQGRKVGHFR